MFSFWERESLLRDVDLAIIGGGIVGLNAALRARALRPHLRIAVVERGAMPEGASTRNAGFACFGSITELMDDLKTMSENEVFALVEKRFRGLQTLRNRVGDRRLKYEAFGNFEIFKHNEQPIFEECMDKMDYFNRQLKQATGLENVYQMTQNKFGFKNILNNLIWNKAEGQLHTGEMMRNLIAMTRKQKIEIWNGLEINEIEDVGQKIRLHTGGGHFEAQKVLVATNGFARKLLPQLDVQPARNQVLVTAPLKKMTWRGAFHYEQGYFYFRNVGKNQILIGGGRNLDKIGEATSEFGITPQIQTALRDLLKNVIAPNESVEILHSWSGILGLGGTKRPIIEHVSPNVVAAVRMGGMGVAIGALVGDEAAELIVNQ
ncbi:MAG: hypothetical protein RL757_1481 [Bacteroidota bacterium]|jgi:glycine/D-amino acid oxidase-like deaminating enzyme